MDLNLKRVIFRKSYALRKVINLYLKTITPGRIYILREVIDLYLRGVTPRTWKKLCTRKSYKFILGRKVIY